MTLCSNGQQSGRQGKKRQMIGSFAAVTLLVGHNQMVKGLKCRVLATEAEIIAISQWKLNDGFLILKRVNIP